MLALLTLSPYLLIPATVTFIWWKYKLLNKWNNVIVTILIAIVFSWLLLKVDVAKLSVPEDEGYRCGLPVLALSFFRFAILVPIAMILQILCNLFFLPGRKKKPHHAITE